MIDNTPTDEFLIDLYWRTTGDDWAIPDHVMVAFGHAVLAARDAEVLAAVPVTVAPTREALANEVGYPAVPDDVDESHSEEYAEGYARGFNNAFENVLASVLVPADLVRAETLREAHAIISKRSGTYEAGIDLMERVAEIEAVAGA